MPSFNPSNPEVRTTTPSLEQYVEAIADLLTRDKVCSVSEIADQVQVSRPAASRAVRELKDKELVAHKAYGYVDLTPEGQSLADSLTARHEALYAFFTEILHIKEDWADQEACRLEHLVDDHLVERLTVLRKFLNTNGAADEAWRAFLGETSEG